MPCLIFNHGELIMSLVKKSLLLFCVGFLGLAQANTSFVTAVLLNEDGSPRCKIVQDDFVETNPQAKAVLNQLDTLEECDNGDELYAEAILNSQDISMSGVPSPKQGAAIIASAFTLTNLAYYCSSPYSNNLLDFFTGFNGEEGNVARNIRPLPLGLGEGIFLLIAASSYKTGFFLGAAAFIAGKVSGGSLAYFLCEPQPRDNAPAEQ